MTPMSEEMDEKSKKIFTPGTYFAKLHLLTAQSVTDPDTDADKGSHVMTHAMTKLSLSLAAVVLLLAACGDDMSAAEVADEDLENDDEFVNDGDDKNQTGGPGANANDGQDPDDDFEPEEEEFLVQQVASTESYVFVPNQAAHSETVAIIDGREFTVHPVRVGLEPSHVVAADVEDQGPVAFVLSGAEPTVAVIRADQGQGAERADVQMLPVPHEVNELAISPDGRHVLAFINPDKPIDDSASAASLQSMAMIRLGDEPGQDEVYELSVTRFIDDIGFTEDGDQAFIVGEDGINLIELSQIKADAFISHIDLEVTGDLFPPQDREAVFSSDATTMVLRTSQFEGIGIFALDADDAQVTAKRLVDLEGVPTDVDVVEYDDGILEAVATIRGQEQVVLIDVDEALEADDEDDAFVRVVDTPGIDAGIGRLTPDQSAMVLYSTLPSIPVVGLLDLETETVEAFELRNQIRSLAISSDGRTAVVVHRRQDDIMPSNDPEEEFRRSEGVTLWDLDSGYRRPIGLRAHPKEIAMVDDTAGMPLLYAMLVDDDGADQGLKRINLNSFATDFAWLPRRPTQLGAVGDQIFVSQMEATGRITFFDVDTQQQRTVSGYELNAGIE